MSLIKCSLFSSNRRKQPIKALEIAYLDMLGHIRNVAFTNGSTSIGSDQKMCPNGRNGAPMVIGVDESIKLPLFEFGEDVKENEEQSTR